MNDGAAPALAGEEAIMQGIVRVPVVFVNAYLVDVEADNPGA